MNKKILITLSFLLVFSAVFGVRNSRDILTKKEKEYLKEKETITFISQTSYHPFEFYSEEFGHNGMCIEVARWIGTEFGFKTEFKNTNFSDAQKSILSGDADVLTSFFYNKERDKKFEFTEKMFDVPVSIFVSDSNYDIENIEDLEGKRIAIQKGDYAIGFLKKKKINYELVDVKNFTQATRMLIENEADAIIGDEPIVLYYIQSNQLSHKIKIIGDPLYNGENCMSTSEENKILISIINKGVKQAEEFGVLNRIQNKWLGIRKLAKIKIFPYMLIFTSILLMILAFIWLWNVSLRKIVAKKTKELENNKEKYKVLFHDNPSMYFIVNKAGIVLSVNEYGASHLGYKVDELLGKNVSVFFAKEDLDKVRSNLESCFENHGEIKNWEVRKLTKDQKFIWVSETVRVINDELGEKKALIICNDISKRKLVEKAAKESQLNYKEIFNSVNDAIFIHDAKSGKILDVNDAMLRMYKCTKEEVLNLGDASIFSQNQPPYDSENIQKHLQNAKKNGVDVFEWKAKRYDDGIFWVEVSLRYYIIGDSERIIALVRNIEERKRMQEMMIQSEKMLSVGGLAAGMAHEINNPLAGMLQTASVMKNRLENEEISKNVEIAKEIGIDFKDILNYMKKRKVPQMIENIEKSGLRASKIVTDMLSFAKDSNISISKNNIVDLINDTIDLASSSYDLKKKFDFKSIKIEKEYKSNLPKILCEKNKIQQVILNILRNGSEAMQEVKKENFNPMFIVRIYEDNISIIIEIEDNGPGMIEKTRKKIFEPFFTTKPSNKGTGLGLSISYFIIKDIHRGEIFVESEKGKGTKFVIKLPK